MRRLLRLAFVLSLAAAPALAGTGSPSRSAATEGCAGAAPGLSAPLQLAQSDCRGRCRASRGYCLSTCRDNFCRAVCNDRYQSCLSSCRR